MKRIVQDLEDSHMYEGELSIAKVFPFLRYSPGDPAGDPYLTVQEEKRTRLLGLIPYKRKTTLLTVKEGSYDVDGTGSRDLFVVLRCRSCETVARQHLEEYGRRHHVAQIVYWGRNRFRPQSVVSL